MMCRLVGKSTGEQWNQVSVNNIFPFCLLLCLCHLMMKGWRSTDPLCLHLCRHFCKTLNGNKNSVVLVQVKQGLILELQFTAFEIECKYDHLTITDADGTTLMEKSCGPSSEGIIAIGHGRHHVMSSRPANITSTSNTVKLMFSTDGSQMKSGWSINWFAVTPGKYQQFLFAPVLREEFLRVSLLIPNPSHSWPGMQPPWSSGLPLRGPC